MKIQGLIRILFVICPVLLTGSCTIVPKLTRPVEAGGALPERGAPAEKGVGDSGLSQRAFDSLPGEARAYLERLALAFSEGDLRYLSDQGEKNYANRVKPYRDIDEYLALLFRIGAYSSESPATTNTLPRLTVSEIQSIRYTGWEELGPLLEIRGRITLKGGAVTPTRILLLWRLVEPKILGIDP